MSISIATININGLRDDKKRRTFFDWLISKKINVICVQETHCTFSEIESWQNLWKSSGGCESRWNCGVRASRGVGVLLYDIDATVKEISSDDFGRILSCELKYENKTYIITNVYCPNDSGVRKTFIRDIDPYVTDGSLTEKMHILTGDFNCVLDKEIDRYPSRNYDDTGGKELKTIMTKNNLINIWREKNPSVKKYTFRRGNSKSRIDLILISEELSCHIINIKIIHCPFSDHDIKIMKLNICDITRGSGTWIMNLHTIRSDYFRQVFTNWWVYWKLEKKSFSNLREWWDIAKIKIKSITIER